VQSKLASLFNDRDIWQMRSELFLVACTDIKSHKGTLMTHRLQEEGITTTNTDVTTADILVLYCTLLTTCGAAILQTGA
jgi:hypothetical protein